MNTNKYTLLIVTLIFILNSVISFGQNKFKVTLDAGHGDHD